ncbi:uncharacterized protein LOC116172658 [Photinus pyralis]|uniref:uncharacterized protein LOC116170757 n=1 Tax=Photinus pyralis TaxID=7054 RepID=UPI001267480D|nr:uncharacterized protein LOC116170757 [Photinus pyralis]XP_031345766.1 uncharacterized protein LOC116172658 [Photinus pyralis]
MEQQVVTQFIKLNENNWNVWKFQIKVILTAKELYDITVGIVKQPDGEHTGKEVKEFKVKDAKAQEVLVTRMESGPLFHILMCESAHEMWTKLESIYERQSNVSVHLLQQKFFNMKFEGSVMDFITKIQNLVAQIKQQKENIPENMVITKILMSLPEQYKHFVSAWESVPEDKRNLTNLSARLLVEEERLGSGEETVAQQSQVKCFSCGKAGHKKDECRSGGRFKNKNVECNFCKKKGHMFKDCWFRKSKQKTKEESSGSGEGGWAFGWSY